MTISVLGIKIDSTQAQSSADKLDRSLRSVTKSGNALDKAVGSTSQRMKTFGDRLQGVGDRAEDIGKKLSTRVTLPITAMGIGILKAAGDFEAGMNRVQALTKATGDEMIALESLSKELGATTQFSASQAADAMGFLAQSGQDANTILQSLPKTLQLAASAQLDLGQAADIVTNIMAGFRLETGELSRANDVLVTAFTSANTDLTQLSEAMKLAGPVASAAGLSFEETAAAISLMGNAGFQGSLAGTALRGAMTRLLNPTKEAAQIMETLGLEMLDTEGNLKTFTEIVQELERVSLDTGDAMEIFGQRAGPAMLALLSQGSGALEDLTQKLEDSGGTAERVANVQMQGFNGAIKELKSSIEAAGLAIAGSGFLANMTDLARSAAEVTREFAASNPELLAWGVTIAGLAAAIGPLTLAFGVMAAGLAKLLTPIGLLITAFTTVSGVVATTLAAVSRFGVGLVLLNTRAALAAAGVTAFNAVLKLTGGPAGFVLLAATGLVTLANRFIDLKPEIQGAKDAMIAFNEVSGQASAEALKALDVNISAQRQKLALFKADILGLIAVAKEQGISPSSIPGFDGLEQAISTQQALVKNLQTEYLRLEGSLASTDASTKASAEAMKELNSAVSETEESTQNAVSGLEGLDDSLKELTVTTEEYTEVLTPYFDELEKLGEAFKTDAELAERLEANLDFLNEQFGNGNIAVERFKDLLNQLAGEQLDLNEALKDGTITFEEYQDAVKAAEENTKKATESLFDMDEALKQVQNNVQSNFSDLFEDILKGEEDAFDNFADRILDIFIKLLADMAAAWAASKIFDADFGGFDFGNIADIFTGGGGGGGNGNPGGIDWTKWGTTIAKYWDQVKNGATETGKAIKDAYDAWQAGQTAVTTGTAAASSAQVLSTSGTGQAVFLGEGNAAVAQSGASGTSSGLSGAYIGAAVAIGFDYYSGRIQRDAELLRQQYAENISKAIRDGNVDISRDIQGNFDIVGDVIDEGLGSTVIRIGDTVAAANTNLHQLGIGATAIIEDRFGNLVAVTGETKEEIGSIFDGLNTETGAAVAAMAANLRTTEDNLSAHLGDSRELWEEESEAIQAALKDIGDGVIDSEATQGLIDNANAIREVLATIPQAHSEIGSSGVSAFDLVREHGEVAATAIAEHWDGTQAGVEDTMSAIEAAGKSSMEAVAKSGQIVAGGLSSDFAEASTQVATSLTNASTIGQAANDEFANNATLTSAIYEEAMTSSAANASGAMEEFGAAGSASISEIGAAAEEAQSIIDSMSGTDITSTHRVVTINETVNAGGSSGGGVSQGGGGGGGGGNQRQSVEPIVQGLSRLEQKLDETAVFNAQSRREEATQMQRELEQQRVLNEEAFEEQKLATRRKAA